MRKRKIIIILAVVLLGSSLAVFLLMRGCGPAVVVNGNLSAKDVAQIKSAVRRELWREAFPDFSRSTIESLPTSVKRAFETHVARIEAYTNDPGRVMAFAYPTTNNWAYGYILTNGGTGWSYYRRLQRID